MGYWYFTYLKLFHLNDFDIPCYVLCSMFYARSVLPKSLRISPTFHWCANDVLLGDEPRLCEVETYTYQEGRETRMLGENCAGLYEFHNACKRQKVLPWEERFFSASYSNVTLRPDVNNAWRLCSWSICLPLPFDLVRVRGESSLPNVEIFGCQPSPKKRRAQQSYKSFRAHAAGLVND